MPAETVTLPAPAKLNLYLAVVGRRPDGYHLLESLMIKLDLADRITLVRRGSEICLDLRGLTAPDAEDNLAVKAAAAFYRAAGMQPGVEITLEKRIPVAAGLGGGSSDAAAVLRGLNGLYGGPLSDRMLFDLAGSLGADVPFFLWPGACALAEGIGERLRPGPDFPAGLYYLLINPGWPLSTAWVFKNYKLELTSARKGLINISSNERSFTISRLLHNDLETVVLPQYPEVLEMKSRLTDCGAEGALMTGSGPTVFGVFRRQQDASNARMKLEKLKRHNWVLFTARTIESPQY